MTWTPEQIDRMSGDEYGQLFKTNPEFVKFVNEMPDVPVARKQVPENLVAARALATARRATAGFDPSFDESPEAAAVARAAEIPATAVTETVVAPVVTPIVEPAVVAPVLAVVEAPATLLLFEYQPEDSNGRPVGGKQVFKYDPTLPVSDPKSLAQQLKKAHTSATVALRETRAKVLTADTSVPDNATKSPVFTEFFVLSAEQKTSLEIEAQDAATGAAARAKLAESARNEALNKSQEDIFTVRSQLALANFKANNPDFYRCNENAVAIINYVMNKNLDPTDENNLQMAYDTLREAGALYGRPVPNQPAAPALATEAPIVREEKTVPKVQTPVVANPRIGADAPPQTLPVAQIPTGLSSADQITDGGEPIATRPTWLTVRVWAKDREGKPTSQFQEFHDLDAIDRSDDKTLKHILNDQSPKGKALRAAWEQAEQEKSQRLAEARRKRGY